MLGFLSISYRPSSWCQSCFFFFLKLVFLFIFICRIRWVRFQIIFLPGVIVKCCLDVFVHIKYGRWKWSGQAKVTDFDIAIMAKKDVGGFDVPMNYIGSMNKVHTAKYIIHYDYHVLLIDVETIHIVNQRLQIWLNMFHYNKNVFYWLRVIIVYFRNNNIINVRCKLVILDLW